MNGPSSMYKLRPIFKLPEEIELPTCMYKLKSPVSTIGSDSVVMNERKNEALCSILDKKPLPEMSALETRWENVLQQLSELKKQMENIKTKMNEVKNKSGSSVTIELDSLKVLQGAVINANPTKPPYSLLLIQNLYKKYVNLSFACHVHSSVTSLPEELNQFHSVNELPNDNSLKLLLIWKDSLPDTELVLNPVKQLPIRGEVNILRHFARLGMKPLDYPSEDAVTTVQTDAVLDICHRLLHVRTVKEKTALFRNLNAKLGRASYFGGEDINISDIAAWSVLKQVRVNPKQDLSQNVASWYLKMDQVLSQ